MSWIVTGGAGYIGSHVVRALADAGLTPVVLDDLSSGVASFVPEGVPFVQGSILDRDLATWMHGHSRLADCLARRP